MNRWLAALPSPLPSTSAGCVSPWVAAAMLPRMRTESRSISGMTRSSRTAPAGVTASITACSTTAAPDGVVPVTTIRRPGISGSGSGRSGVKSRPSTVPPSGRGARGNGRVSVWTVVRRRSKAFRPFWRSSTTRVVRALIPKFSAAEGSAATTRYTTVAPGPGGTAPAPCGRGISVACGSDMTRNEPGPRSEWGVARSTTGGSVSVISKPGQRSPLGECMKFWRTVSGSVRQSGAL